jgi:hypothetical protein
MKINLILRTFAIVAILFSFSSGYSQNCKVKTCKIDNNDGFDYRNKSQYGKVTSGDKSRLNIPLYPGNSYKVFICADPKLGSIPYKVFEVQRETKVSFNDNKDTVLTYKRKDVQIFDGTPGQVWELKRLDRTKTYVIEVNVPPADKDVQGCLNIMIGSKKAGKGSFSTEK